MQEAALSVCICCRYWSYRHFTLLFSSCFDVYLCPVNLWLVFSLRMRFSIVLPHSFYFEAVYLKCKESGCVSYPKNPEMGRCGSSGSLDHLRLLFSHNRAPVNRLSLIVLCLELSPGLRLWRHLACSKKWRTRPGLWLVLLLALMGYRVLRYRGKAVVYVFTSVFVSLVKQMAQNNVWCVGDKIFESKKRHKACFFGHWLNRSTF